MPSIPKKKKIKKKIKFDDDALNEEKEEKYNDDFLNVTLDVVWLE